VLGNDIICFFAFEADSQPILKLALRIEARPSRFLASHKMGSWHVRGLVARIWHGLSRGSVVRRDFSREQTKWIASINSAGLGEFLEREIAMRRVEELVESSMALALHDWELYQAAKRKR
jgi:hypothetical protein